MKAFALALVAALAWAGAAFAQQGGNGAATITGAFSDGCRDFTSHATKVNSQQGKDISYVDVHYADGRIVKDETVNSPDYSLDGAAGGEIAFAIVKSGTTTQPFHCVRENRPPTALLEIKTPVDGSAGSPDGEIPPDGCFTTFFSGLLCPAWEPRNVWRSSTEFPYEQLDGGVAGGLFWICRSDLPSPSTFDVRGTSSSDPDGDITTWSLDFGDGTSAGGSWTTNPPVDAVHTYGPLCTDDISYYVTLTVTDAAGQSASDTILMRNIDGNPD